ncbi:filamin-A-interacting protein 1-like isoform X1 [Phyllopteryx taeniolatus]|uniref:filamin-A-interacting protein 1-like isoform X1 n=2 Tax=Phyllopteryx taeniolatus TaxID=161469 RepID=UPI002AD3C5F2|nr:filamin-A-interacting protein 1-like isoform X1 [Phyllopteryx taeniolatus]XP_061610269.1 filamin-A-interacting protein 1-like isoform X1 [Phyllopteryx taeniolatus]
MRSRKCTMEKQDDGHKKPKSQGSVRQEEETSAEFSKKKAKVQREEKDRKLEQKSPKVNLSKKDLLQLLGIMEGEVQAREDVIGLLRSERSRPKKLESRYGWSVPAKALQALQRDDGMFTCHNRPTDDVYEKPMAELDRLEDKQRETYRRMLEQLLLAEKCHRRTVMELDSEKSKHANFIHKSDDFTNLLEEERERLKKLLKQEEAYQAHKDKEHSRRLEKLRAQLVKLKSFALMLVDERQLNTEQLDLQSQKVRELTHKLQDKERRLADIADVAKEDGRKVLKIEAELEHRVATSKFEMEEMTAKLSNQDSQNRQLRLKLAGLASQIEELQESNRWLQQSDEDLHDLRDKISKGECGNTSLMAELETLRKKVLEMEGKDEEITKTESQCRDLGKRLQDEENVSKELRLEVDKLQRRMAELEKLEGAFGRSQTECSQLHAKMEKEKQLGSDLEGELETLKRRLKEMESLEVKLERAEMILKDDLMKLKSFTVILVEERKNMAERLKQEQEEKEELCHKFKSEECKVTEVMEKLIDDSKKLLRFKSETEVKVARVSEENDDLKSKLLREQERCRQLNTDMREMKAMMEETQKTKTNQEGKIKELTLETENLRSRLERLEVVEGDLMKTEDQYELLEKRFRVEQEKANSLSKHVEEMTRQTSHLVRSKSMEKGQMASPEAQLRTRCKMEEAKSRDLEVQVQALKEKIHQLMPKEDQLSQLQTDYSVLLQRFLEEEEKRKSVSQEVADLSQKLEASRRYSRTLRPGINGRRMVDARLMSTAAQTDALDGSSAEDFIRKSVLEEKHLMSNLRQRGLKKPIVLERYPHAMAEPETTRMRMTPEVSISQKPGKPLHIRVTPDPTDSTATVEITGPQARDFFSSTTVIPTLGLHQPHITIVPKATAVTTQSKTCDVAGPVQSPVTITTISRTKSPDTNNSRLAPLSIVTISTGPVPRGQASPEPPHGTADRTVITVGPDKRPGTAVAPNFSNNIITTEDKKIHIRLRTTEKQDNETAQRTLEGKTEAGKMSSSLTITPVTAAMCRPTTSVTSWGWSTRLPVATKADKTGTESCESQVLKIKLRKSSPASSAP